MNCEYERPAKLAIIVSVLFKPCVFGPIPRVVIYFKQKRTSTPSDPKVKSGIVLAFTEHKGSS